MSAPSFASHLLPSQIRSFDLVRPDVLVPTFSPEGAEPVPFDAIPGADALTVLPPPPLVVPMPLVLPPPPVVPIPLVLPPLLATLPPPPFVLDERAAVGSAKPLGPAAATGE